MTDIDKYYFRHKEHVIAEFYMNSYVLTEDDYYIKNFRIFNEERLPFDLRCKSNEIYAQQMLTWIRHRGLAESRSDLSIIMQMAGAGNTIELMMNSYGLNLSDQYWLHKASENLNWKDINFFDNNFKEVINEEYSSFNHNKIIISPNFTVDGTMRKWWTIDNSNNSRILIKESLRNVKQEPYNEKIVSDILDLFSIKHIKYQLGKYNYENNILSINNEEDTKNIPVSVCNCEINNKCELVPAKMVLNSKQNENILNYHHYTNICKNNGILDIKERLDEMMAIDFLVGNDDRHTHNFGIIRNADSLEYERIMPIFDNGNAFYINIYNIDETFDIPCKWHQRTPEGRKTNKDMLQFIDYPSWYDSKKIKKIPEMVYNELSMVPDLKKEKLEKIVELTDDNIKYFEKIISKKTKNSL